jgi:hypothetical protein
VSDLLSQSVWRAVVDASIYLPQDGNKRPGRFIALDALEKIVRKSRRSSDQNALLWSLYTDILRLGGEQLAGFTKEELHEFFLIDYFGSETKELFGRKKLKPLRRSSRLTKAEFTDFVDHIVRFAAERGIVLDLPGEISAE